MLLSLDEMKRVRDWARRQGLKVGLTNGCFDLLHIGHIAHLTQARRHCDLLFVAVNSDASVGRLKSGRPVLPERERALSVAALQCVDYVVVFDGPNASEVVRELDPDVYVQTEEYQGKLPEGQYARRVEWTTDRLQSTTDIINKIKGSSLSG